MEDSKKNTRRRHSRDLKAQVLAECTQAGASVARVALAHGINANVVHKWRRQAGINSQVAAAPTFVPVSLPPSAPAPAADIRIGAAPGRHDCGGDVAGRGCSRVRSLAARAAEVIRIEAVWLAVDPLDMRAGSETILAKVVQVFGAAQPHHAYCFANRRASRLKILVHDGIGVWLAARRLHQGGFVWPRPGAHTASITREQLDALALGLPWQRIGQAGVITVL